MVFLCENTHGDIIGILDSQGNRIVNYIYDSWGKLVNISGTHAQTIGVINPYRYRSYRYATAGGNWAKFATNSKTKVNKWIKKGLKSKNAMFYNNKAKDSYYIITDLGRKIGSKGQTKIKIVFDSAGNIWTAMPVR